MGSSNTSTKDTRRQRFHLFLASLGSQLLSAGIFFALCYLGALWVMFFRFRLLLGPYYALEVVALWMPLFVAPVAPLFGAWALGFLTLGGSGCGRLGPSSKSESTKFSLDQVLALRNATGECKLYSQDTVAEILNLLRKTLELRRESDSSKNQQLQPPAAKKIIPVAQPSKHSKRAKIKTINDS